MDTATNKSNAALREEAVLAFWKERGIFEKTVAKEAPQGDFVFFEGPPTANAKPALHHLEARAFKDVIPRYKTMQGYHVPRRAGWDTHGLPVELQIEKKLGLKNKKEIESYGIAAFNRECKESVFTFIKDWEYFTDRMGYWVDKERAYYTFNTAYMESLWNIVSKVHERGLLYMDYKVVPWCPRCGTGLSSHELAQGYQDVKDLSVYAKFKVSENTYLLAWTTTPWTLPGNVALAVGKDITYVKVLKDSETLILAKERLSLIEGQYEITAEMMGSDLVGTVYEPLYPFLAEAINDTEKLAAAYKVYAADFVTTTDGTGIVHTAVMYGQDDFELGTKVGLPKFHTVQEDGRFISTAGFLAGRFVKDEDVAVDIIKDLAHRGLLFKKEKYEHSYPHCWRCKTPLIYYARDSWYIAMSRLKDELMQANNLINWEPGHIKEGRFGEWIRDVKDWAISRERYWGTPLPVWTNKNKELLVVDSVKTIRTYGKRSGNAYFVMRHGQTENNLKGLWSCDGHHVDPLTSAGEAQVQESAVKLKNERIDVIIASPFPRTQQTAQLVAQHLGLDSAQVISDERLGEWNVGSQYDGKDMNEFFSVRNSSSDRYHFKTEDGESYAEVFTRSSDFLYSIEETYSGKNILIISHGAVTRALELATYGCTFDTMHERTKDYQNFNNAEVRKLDFTPLPHNEFGELDLHRPYIDSVVLVKDGEEFHRVKEVMDVWFDSGAMPFAQDHYPFENKEWIDTKGYPADFISEAIDQTRGWFYTLLAIGVLMERGTSYKNVICLGLLLDKDGKKMSKSIGNIVEPFEQMDKFGVDAVRFWMYSVNAPGESKNYDEKSVAEINNKVFNLYYNVLSFYELYRDRALETSHESSMHVLDQWIIARTNLLVSEVTDGLDSYDLFRPTRAIRDYMDDLSTWYVRRSRDRIKEGDSSAKRTLYTALMTVAKMIAPFAPFTAEDVWQKLKREADEESVHLASWPMKDTIDESILKTMGKVREIATMGNASRKKQGIPVRQPLQKITIATASLEDAYIEIIKDELNIKEVVFVAPSEQMAEGQVELDTIITPALKLEGQYREVLRTVQDMRKARGLSPSDAISLRFSPNMESIVTSFIEEFKKTVQAADVAFDAVSGEEVTIGELTYIMQMS